MSSFLQQRQPSKPPQSQGEQGLRGPSKQLGLRQLEAADTLKPGQHQTLSHQASVSLSVPDRPLSHDVGSARKLAGPT